ncbi:MAG TPA: PQQ-binding-like beta-propeller repeat protein, partial [Planctomycetota bacterium]|nr:PQQ-binding-like beta-propeller repeat protein [Planctomycetota bacterium]
FLKAIDPQTGKDIWHQWRHTEAREESLESYGTPILYTANGREELALFGGDLVSAHDPATGKELWHSDGYNEKRQKNWRSIPGSVLIDGNVVSISARGGRIFAVKPGGSGDVTATNVVWNTNELTSDVCMPLFYQGKLYVLDGDKKKFRCADPQTGAVLWQGDIPTKAVLRASPTGGGGRIYTMDETGTVFVLAADKFAILGTYGLGAGGTARSTVVLSHGQVIVRTAEKLLAFGSK